MKILDLQLKRVLFSQLKVGETYYEYYTDSRDKFIGFDGYCAIFKNNIFFGRRNRTIKEIKIVFASYNITNMILQNACTFGARLIIEINKRILPVVNKRSL